MFTDFKIWAKTILKDNGMTYADLSELTGYKESTIRAFMCSKRGGWNVAEKIADVLGVGLMYSHGVVYIRPQIKDRIG